MKKFLLLLPLAAMLTLSSFAGSPADPLTEQSFKKQFTGAENIAWTTLNTGFVKVSFIWHGQRTEAWFNAQAELVASARNIFSNQLPMVVSRSVQANFSHGTVSDISEIFVEESTNYTFTLEEGAKKYRVRMDSYGEIVSKEKVKK